jgi:hypothetical protein
VTKISELSEIGAHLAPGMAPEDFRAVRIIPLSWSPFTESNRRPSPYHGAARSISMTRYDDTGLAELGAYRARTPSEGTRPHRR